LTLGAAPEFPTGLHLSSFSCRQSVDAAFIRGQRRENFAGSPAFKLSQLVRGL